MINEQSWARELDSSTQQDRVSTLENLRDKLKERGKERGLIEKTIQKPSEGWLRTLWQTLLGSTGTVIVFIILSLFSLAYLNFHYIMYKFVPGLGKFFCKFGEEGAFGMIPPPAQIKKSAKAAKGMGGEEVAGTYSIGSELAELIVVLVADLLMILIILILATLISFIYWACTDPAGLISAVGLEETINFIHNSFTSS